MRYSKARARGLHYQTTGTVPVVAVPVEAAVEPVEYGTMLLVMVQLLHLGKLRYEQDLPSTPPHLV